MKTNSTFQYVLPKNNLVQLPLKTITKEFQRPIYKTSMVRPSSVEQRNTYAKDFIPSSLTAPHINQYRSIFNQVRPINIVNITPVHQNQQMNNYMPLKTNNNITMNNISAIPNHLPQGSYIYNKNYIQNVPIISNNNIINNINNQTIQTSSVKPDYLYY